MNLPLNDIVKNGDRKAFLIAILVLTFWFYIVVDRFNSFVAGNPIMAYVLFLAAYIFLMIKAFLKIELSPMELVSFIMVFVALDIISYPIMINQYFVPELRPEQIINSQVFVYRMLPDTIPHQFKFFITYILIPSVLLICARKLAAHERKFKKIVRDVALP